MINLYRVYLPRLSTVEISQHKTTGWLMDKKAD